VSVKRRESVQTVLPQLQLQRGVGAPCAARVSHAQRELARRAGLRAALISLASLISLAGCGDAPRSERDAPPAQRTAERARSDGAANDAWFKMRVGADGQPDPTAGIGFVHRNGATREKHLPETMGGGAAIVDVDEDGDLDLYFVQSGPMRLAGKGPGQFVEPPGALPGNELYLNDGRGHFSDATKASGAAADTHYGMGIAVGDANGDGHADFYLTNLGPDVLVEGDGRAHFTDATSASGLRDERWTTGAVFFDADDDGDLDLFVASYVVVDLAHPDWCGERKDGWRSYCHPDRYIGMEDRFWRNDGRGHFSDETKSAGFDDPNGKGLGVVSFDYDDDGWLDLYVANDSTENRLYHNTGDGTFEDATLISGTGVDRYGRTEASMGIAIGDVDLDGRLDLFVTGFDDESDTLYTNLGKGLFEDRTVQRGLELATRLPVGFGCVFEDFDHDGALDLAIANGHIIDNIELYNDNKSWKQNALVFRNDGLGRFADVSARARAVTDTAFVGRGLYTGDLDGDGQLDLVLTQCGGAPRIVFGNVSGRSLSIDGAPHGARVVVQTKGGRSLVREALPRTSYLGNSAPALDFGLGTDVATFVRIRPLGGKWQEIPLDPAMESGHLHVSGPKDALQIRR